MGGVSYADETYRSPLSSGFFRVAQGVPGSGHLELGPGDIGPLG